jgi:hypothetical protein
MNLCRASNRVYITLPVVRETPWVSTAEALVVNGAWLIDPQHIRNYTSGKSAIKKTHIPWSPYYEPN